MVKPIVPFRSSTEEKTALLNMRSEQSLTHTETNPPQAISHLRRIHNAIAFSMLTILSLRHVLSLRHISLFQHVRIQKLFIPRFFQCRSEIFSQKALFLHQCLRRKQQNTSRRNSTNTENSCSVFLPDGMQLPAKLCFATSTFNCIILNRLKKISTEG